MDPAPAAEQATGIAGRGGIAWASLGFAVALAVFLITPAFLTAPYPSYSLLHWGDVLDLATAVVVLPAAWILFLAAGTDRPGTVPTIVFLALAAMWASAQGMHLAANAIGHLASQRLGDVWQLTYDLDEVISHYLWHAALLGWTALFAWRSLAGRPQPDALSRGAWGGLLAAAVVYGFTFFIIVVEGQTAPMALPAAAAIVLGVLVLTRGGLPRRPAAGMVAVACVVALSLCLVWAGMNDWQLLEFSEAGLVP